MKYIVLIMDGAAGLPLVERGGQTCLELADTPHLDSLAREGTVGRVRTVPPGLEPSSAAACMSVLGYDPKVYYRGRAGIEAKSMGIPTDNGDVVFRCNLVTVSDGIMRDYSAGHISSGETADLIDSLQAELGNDYVSFHPGTGYRSICRIKGHEETLQATCTPPHDIPDKAIEEFLPRGPGSELLRDLMSRSVDVLQGHPVNKARLAKGQPPATMLWLFWGSGKAPEMPDFQQIYGLKAAMTSGVDLLTGLARMVGMEILDIPGVTDGLDNDYVAQAAGALSALDGHDLVVIHIEAPDEAAHGGLIDDKIAAIERIDREVVARIRAWSADKLRALIMPDHPTPIAHRTHTGDPVPFLLWGEGIPVNGATGFSEAEAVKTGLYIEDGYKIMGRLVEG